MIPVTNQAEIVHAGRIIEADRAMRCGDAMLALAREFGHNHTTLNPAPSQSERSTLIPHTNRFNTGVDDQETIDIAAESFKTMIPTHGKEGLDLTIGSDVFVGTAGGGEWHIDMMEEYRLLVNLSRGHLELLVAKEWSNQYSDPLLYDQTPTPPSQYERLSYEPGEGLLLNNYCDWNSQIPHAGIHSDGKVFLRLFTRETLPEFAS